MASVSYSCIEALYTVISVYQRKRAFANLEQRAGAETCGSVDCHVGAHLTVVRFVMMAMSSQQVSMVGEVQTCAAHTGPSENENRRRTRLMRREAGIIGYNSCKVNSPNSYLVTLIEQTRLAAALPRSPWCVSSRVEYLGNSAALQAS